MKKYLVLILSLIILVPTAVGQKKKESRTQKNLKTHVYYLASDELEGRRTGEKGATSAAGYISNMFQRYKLKPGFNGSNGKDGFLQPFEYVANVEFSKDSTMTLNGNSAVRGGDWSPFAFSPKAELSETMLKFVLHGISSSRLKHDDYEGIDANGYIAVALSGAPEVSHPHSRFNNFNTHAKANVAKQKGAIALVIIAAEDELKNDRAAAQKYNQSLGETAVPVVIVSRSVGAKMLGLKDAKSVGQIEKWLMSKPANASVRFSEISSTSSLKLVTDKKKVSAYNVVGVIPGKDKADEAIIIGAHYDHLGRGGRGSLAPNSNEIHNGADDNASGTAALIELARQFRKEKKNSRTIIFIGFGGEEEGLLGSKAYVQNPVFPIDKTVAMINMDMVGRLTNKKLTVGGIGTAPRWKQLVEKLNSPNVSAVKKPNRKLADGVQATNVSFTNSTLFDLRLSQDGFGPSDHASFYAAKIPVLFFFTGTHSDYHKPSDDADKINYAGLETITAFVKAIAKSVDSGAERPKYTVAKSTAPMGGRRGFNVSLGTIPAYGDSDNTGLKLDGVRKGSSADKAGIKGGDKIVQIGDKEIRNISDYMFMLGEMKAGEKYQVVVEREGARVELTIIPAPRSR